MERSNGSKGDTPSMIATFVETSVFSRQWAGLGLSDDDLLELQNQLMKNPQSGDVISGTGGTRKVRFALSDKGKSGGARVIYVNVVLDKEIHLLLCYPKGKQDALTDEQKKQLKAVIGTIKEGKRGK